MDEIKTIAEAPAEAEAAPEAPAYAPVVRNGEWVGVLVNGTTVPIDTSSAQFRGFLKAIPADWQQQIDALAAQQQADAAAAANVKAKAAETLRTFRANWAQGIKPKTLDELTAVIIADQELRS